jgi:hypothetical protein
MHPAWVPVALDPGAQARANVPGGHDAPQKASKKGGIQACAATPLIQAAG